jgi:hypothetical protein
MAEYKQDKPVRLSVSEPKPDTGPSMYETRLLSHIARFLVLVLCESSLTGNFLFWQQEMRTFS